MNGSEKIRQVLDVLKSTKTLRFVAILLTGAISLLILIYPFSIRPNSYLLQIGDVAPQDILALRDLSYQSEILTSETQIDAGKSISDVYLPADTMITRSQIQQLSNALDYVELVRNDSFGSGSQKIIDIQAADKLPLENETIISILQADEVSWAKMRPEALRVLEQVMRNTIRDDRLRDVQRNVPAYISFALTETETSIVMSLVTPFIVLNSLYSEELTQEAVQEAVQSVTPSISSYLEGEKIAERGQIITPLIYEALQAFELVQPKNNSRIVIAASVLILLSCAFLLLYYKFRQIPEFTKVSNIILICILFILFLTGIRIFDPGNEFLLYIYPLSAFSLSIAFLYRRDVSMGLIPVISIFAAYGMTNSLTLAMYFLFSSMIGVLVLGNGRRIASFFWAGLAVSLSGIAVIIAFRLLNAVVDWAVIAPLIGASFMNGLASAGFALLLQFLFAQLLGITTPLRLLDISRPDHPLLQMILRESPGTYQHSLQVANLAEQAAEEIGADSLLVRVGALYHDAGKAVNPTYFIENQVPGMANPHDSLDPQVSSQIITKHIPDGVFLAKRFRLPPRIQDFMREHHGTMLTNYQYSIAVQNAGNDPQKVDSDKYRYPGPSPLSKETALLMLADNVEARARALLPKNEEELRVLIKKTVDYLQQKGQLSYTNLTMNEIYRIQESFVKTLKNTHHLRLQYPEPVENQPQALLLGNMVDDGKPVI